MIGCDVGSQGTNAALYTADGTLVAEAYEKHELLHPRPGWAEQDPQEWIHALQTAIRRLLSAVPEGRSAVRAISFGTQLDGLVACDAGGHALRPALIWMDRRAEEQASAVAERISRADFYASTGVNLDSSHAAFKALWIRDNEPELFASASHLLPPGAFLLRQTAGVAVCDHSNASSLGLLDPRTRAWSGPALEAAEIDSALLPELTTAVEPVGTVTAAFASATGLAADTIVVAGCGDEMAATLGAGVYAAGEVCDVAGTAEPVCAASTEPRWDPTMLVECHPHADPDSWLLENPGFVSGGNLRWWRDQFAASEQDAEQRGGGDAYDLLVNAASRVPPGADGLVFLPCMQGAMAPEWNGAARGAFYGLTLAHTRAHLTRALLEGSAFALRDIVEAMRDTGLEIARLTIVGGGAKSYLWRQIKADVTGVPVRVPTNVETTATGAAILAAAGAGLYPEVASSAAAFVTYDPQELEPDPGQHEAYSDAYMRYRDLYFALRPLFDSTPSADPQAQPSSIGPPVSG